MYAIKNPTAMTGTQTRRQLMAALAIAIGSLAADGNRVFELLVYHTLPGKVPALESISRYQSG